MNFTNTRKRSDAPAPPRADGPNALSCLGAAELALVQDLAAVVQAFDGIELKLNWELMTARKGESLSDFCYFHAGRLVGFIPLDGEGEEREITAAVAPDFRRRGVFGSLPALAREEALRRGAASLLLVSYRDSLSCAAAVQSIALPYRFSEYRMEADSWVIPASDAHFVQLTLVGAEDIDALAQMLVETFGSNARSAESLAREREGPGVRYFFARSEGERVGHIGVIDVVGGIYLRAVGIRGEHRGRGLGRALLLATLHTMAAEGYTHFSLDVANANALCLYESCGFRSTTVYDYYEALSEAEITGDSAS